MKRWKKKINLGLLTIASVTTPLATVIACNYDKLIFGDEAGYGQDIRTAKVTQVLKDTIVRPFDWSDIKKYGKNQPLFERGIGAHSHAHGTSFLYNIARKLGWKIFGGEGVVTGGSKSDKEDAGLLMQLMQGVQPEKYAKRFSSGQVWLEAFGTDGVMGEEMFAFSGVNPLKVQHSYTSGGHRKMDVMDAQGKKRVVSYSIGVKPTFFSVNANFFQFIDGDHPGSIVLNTKVTVGNANFNHHFSSDPSFYQLFTKIDTTVPAQQAKLEELTKLYFRVLKNLNDATNNKKVFSAVKSNLDMLHPKVKEFFEFIRDMTKKDPKNPGKNINGGDLIDFKNDPFGAMNKIRNIIKNLNNGSHDLFALEIFARGVNNVPKSALPKKTFVTQISINSSDEGNLVGLANMETFQDFLSWAAPNENKLPNLGKRASFDPDTMSSFMSFSRTREWFADVGGIVNPITNVKYGWEKNWKDTLKEYWETFQLVMKTNRTAITNVFIEEMYDKITSSRPGVILPVLGVLIDKKTNDEIVAFRKSEVKKSVVTKYNQKFKDDLYNWLIDQTAWNNITAKKPKSNNGASDLIAWGYNKWKTVMDKYHGRSYWDKRGDKKRRGLGGYLMRSWSKELVPYLPGTPNTGLSHPQNLDLRLSNWISDLIESSLTHAQLAANMKGKVSGDIVTESDLGITPNITDKSKYRIVLKTAYNAGKKVVAVEFQLRDLTDSKATPLFVTVQTFTIKGI